MGLRNDHHRHWLAELMAHIRVIIISSCDVDVIASCACRGWGGTLVVSPTPIHGQWLAELKAHSGLKVEVYYGLQWHRQEGEANKRGRVRAVFSPLRL